MIQRILQRRSAGLVAALLAALFLSGTHGFLLAEDPPAPEPVSAAEELAALIYEMDEFNMRESPLWATYIGDTRYNDQLGSVSVEDELRRQGVNREFYARLQTIDHDALERDDQINLEILLRQMEDGFAENEFKSYLMPLTNRSGFHLSFTAIPEQVPLNDVQDYENYIARLRAFGEYADGHIEIMRAGMEAGVMPSDIVLDNWEVTVEPQIVSDPAQSVYFAPFNNFPRGVPLLRRRALVRAGRQAIAESVVPAYQRLYDFLEEEYVPAARGSVGISAMEGGRAYYRHRVQMYTTLEITPEEVHQIGLEEVARITAEMEAVRDECDFEGTLQEFFEFLRTDPQFYVDTPEELLAEASFILKEIDGKLPQYFGRLPRTPYGIRPVPDYDAPNQAAAYYMRATGDGTTAGFFYLNTYNLPSRPTYELTALSLHEAVPGHHLQLALQQELEDLPNFRRNGGFTVFVEGWGLYAESLGIEMGMYEDPYDDFGRLTYEMWRACRLVVDTGIHYEGWTRQQAIDYMAEHTPLSHHNIRAEVDRYIGLPGQALAYKMGELKIKALREEAETALGEEFDLRAFHDVVLGSGAVPLYVLEENVHAWIAAGGPATTGQPQAEAAVSP